jgi:predicted hotdog family 3-hydroxylacyl-ACP dehydratase
VSALPPIAELLPHRGPALLLDELIAQAPERVTCRVTVRADAAYARDGRLPAVLALEYMAQTIGAWVGLRARARGEPVRIGFLLGTRELRLFVDDFAAGDVLDVDAEHVWGDSALGSFRCAVRRAGSSQVLAEATINAFQGDKDQVEEVARR